MSLANWFGALAASAILVAGLLAFRRRPGVCWQARAGFAAFLVLWGTMLLLGNLTQFTSSTRVFEVELDVLLALELTAACALVWTASSCATGK